MILHYFLFYLFLDKAVFHNLLEIGNNKIFIKLFKAKLFICSELSNFASYEMFCLFIIV